MKKIVLISCLSFLILPVVLSGQNVWTLSVLRSDSVSALKKISYQKKFRDSAARHNELLAIIGYLHDKAFLEARFDTLQHDSLHLLATLYAGPRYRIRELKIRPEDDQLLRRSGYSTKNLRRTYYHKTSARNMLETPVIALENSGYPFAQARFDSMEISGAQVSAWMVIDPGNRIHIDSLVKKGNLRITKNYMFRYLGIRPGDMYNESRIRRIDQRLGDIPFASPVKPVDVVFWHDRAKVFLYLNKRKANQFSGILGVLPNANVPGKLLINGELKLFLLNSFSLGETIDLNWRSMEKQTQDLKLHLNFPYLFTTPFGLEYRFVLFKKDTSYLSMRNKIGLQYLLGANNFVQVYADIFNSDIIRAAGIENTTVLPPYADIRRTLYGLQVQFEKLDYRMNPRKGYRITADVSGGLKTIKKNERIKPEIYDSLRLRTGQVQALATLEYYLPLYKKHIMLFGLNSGYILNEQLFQNELFRLGGLNSLRGFDEEEIEASAFGIMLLEYRFLFERNSFLSLFWNGALTERISVNQSGSGTFQGFGAGISFDTRIGIFSLYYALGAQNNNPIDFRQSKIHFGMRTFF